MDLYTPPNAPSTASEDIAVMVQSATLCMPCQIKLREARQSGDHASESTNGSTIARAGKLGCPICCWTAYILLHREPELGWLPDVPPPWTNLDSVDTVGHENNSLHRQFSFPEPGARRTESGTVCSDVLFLAICSDRNRILARFQVLLERCSSEQKCSGCYTPAANTAAESTFDLIRSWSRRCFSSHQLCRSTTQSRWRPSRLINISKDELGIKSLRLQEAAANEFGSAVEYATLSHRWLPEEAVLLTTENRLELRKSIRSELLKDAILDAVEASLRLEVTYLWVDTLCILQDDGEDKAREVASMHHIYEHSMYTIAADAGDNDSLSARCFVSRGVERVTAYDVHLDLDNFPSNYRMRVVWDERDTELRNSVLGQRAWVFQERFLTPRLIHYCKHEVYWQCREFEASETYPEGRPASYRGETMRPFLDDRILGSDVASARLRVPPWRDIVAEYTGLHLTSSDDLLRALTGIANFCAHYYDDEYILGSFRRTIVRDLLWLRLPSQGHKQERLLNAAPSWSWASRYGPTLYLYISGERVACTFVDFVDVIHRSETGQPDHRTMLHLKGSPFNGTFGSWRVQGRTIIIGNGSDEGEPMFHLDIDEDDFDDSETTILPVLCNKYDGSDGPGWYQAGLVLEPQETLDGTPVYRRVGSFHIFNREMQMGSKEDLYLC